MLRVIVLSVLLLLPGCAAWQKPHPDCATRVIPMGVTLAGMIVFIPLIECRGEDVRSSLPNAPQYSR